MAKVDALQAVCKAHNVPLGAAALQFALAHPVIASVLTGPKSPAELKGILDWWNAAIPDAFWDQLADQKLVEPDAAAPTQRTHCVSQVPKVLMVDVDGVWSTDGRAMAVISSPTSRRTSAFHWSGCRPNSSSRIGLRSLRVAKA